MKSQILYFGILTDVTLDCRMMGVSRIISLAAQPSRHEGNSVGYDDPFRSDQGVPNQEYLEALPCRICPTHGTVAYQGTCLASGVFQGSSHCRKRLFWWDQHYDTGSAGVGPATVAQWGAHLELVKPTAGLKLPRHICSSLAERFVPQRKQNSTTHLIKTLISSPSF